MKTLDLCYPHNHFIAGSIKNALKMILLFAATLMLLSCEKSENNPEILQQFGSETAIIEEISFKSGGFTIVGDLRIPQEGNIHPVVIMVHGSGSATRQGAVDFEPMIEIFLRNGYAVFSWDKPGSGESTGQFVNGQVIFQRADILVKAVEVLKDNSSIDPTNIGCWGISQAGWVIPNALEKTDGIKFMIVVSGGGEDGIDQGAFQQGQMLLCEGGFIEDAATVEHYWSEMNKATTYGVYKNAVENLLEIPWIVANTPITLQEEANWSPWPRDIDAFYDPMTVIRETRMPILAFFGGNDRYIDPHQGANAYEAAFDIAGNNQGELEFIADANHVMIESMTGCPGEAGNNQYMKEYLETLELWLQNF